jgi:acetylornithine aminotransferase
LLPGIRLAPFGDAAALAAEITDRTIALMLEPIQGEGGVVVPSSGFLRDVRELCDRHGLLLILDEVQTGLGRTGRLFAYEHAGIVPDIVTLAKALGSGLPIGATLARADVAGEMGPGSHGSTFGGNPIACAAAVRTLEVLLGEGVLERSRELGPYLGERLRRLAARFPAVRAVRGMGLMWGMELDRPARPVVEACLREGVVINVTAERVLRLLPPLVVSRAELDEGCRILERVLGQLLV